MRRIDVTHPPATAGAPAGLTEGFGRIARQRASDRAVAPAPAARQRSASGRPAERADVSELLAAAQTARARHIGELLARMLHAVAASARRLVSAGIRARRLRPPARPLPRLDARALQDLGLGRNDFTSLAERLERDDDTLRLRTLRAANALRLF